MAEDRSYGLAWFLAGIGGGALVGVLYAPKSGRETREDLVSGAKEGTEYLRARTREAAESVSTLVDKGKGQVGEYADRSREVVDADPFGNCGSCKNAILHRRQKRRYTLIKHNLSIPVT